MTEVYTQDSGSLINADSPASRVDVRDEGIQGAIGIAWHDAAWEIGQTYQARTGLTHNGSSYRATSVHVADADNEPGVGDAWDDVWALIADDGDDGWTPLLAVVEDGIRRIVRVIGWTGGQGTPPASGKYVGPSGLVVSAADATNIRGATGAAGWSPIFAMVPSGARRVLQIVGWTGGEGSSPAAGLYLGAEGLVETIGDAVDVRGATGAAGVFSAGYTINRETVLVGIYPLSKSSPDSGTINRVYAENYGGAGSSFTFRILINGAASYGPVTVAQGTPSDVRNLELVKIQYAAFEIEILSVTGAAKLWIEADGAPS